MAHSKTVIGHKRQYVGDYSIKSIRSESENEDEYGFEYEILRKSRLHDDDIYKGEFYASN